MLFKQPSSRARDDENDNAPIWSPAIKTALEDWYTAKHEHDDDGLKTAARDIINATAAYHRAAGVPLFAHHPLPPQFVEAELGDVHALPEAHAHRVANSLIEKFDDSAKPVVSQQVAGLLKAKSSDPILAPSDNVNSKSAGSQHPAPAGLGPKGELSGGAANAAPANSPIGPETRGWSTGRPTYEPEDAEQEWWADASPQERYDWVQAEMEAARRTVPLLGRALYELSPLPDAQQFVDDVRSGRYASAALAVVLMALPELKAARVTHHIVARLARQHKELREFIGSAVNIDDPANFARIIEDVHRVLHTNNYYNYVAQRLQGARNADELRAALRDIRDLLERLEGRADSRKLFPPKRPPKI